VKSEHLTIEIISIIIASFFFIVLPLIYNVFDSETVMVLP